MKKLYETILSDRIDKLSISICRLSRYECLHEERSSFYYNSLNLRYAWDQFLFEFIKSLTPKSWLEEWEIK